MVNRIVGHAKPYQQGWQGAVERKVSPPLRYRTVHRGTYEAQ